MTENHTIHRHVDPPDITWPDPELPPGGPERYRDSQMFPDSFILKFAGTEESSGPNKPVHYKIHDKCDVLDQGLWTPCTVQKVENGDVRVSLMRKYWYWPDEHGQYPLGEFYTKLSQMIVKNHQLQDQLRTPIIYKKYDKVEVKGQDTWIGGRIAQISDNKTLIGFANEEAYLWVRLDCWKNTTKKGITLTDEQMRNIVRRYDSTRIRPEFQPGYNRYTVKR